MHHESMRQPRMKGVSRDAEGSAVREAFLVLEDDPADEVDDNVRE